MPSAAQVGIEYLRYLEHIHFFWWHSGYCAQVEEAAENDAWWRTCIAGKHIRREEGCKKSLYMVVQWKTTQLLYLQVLGPSARSFASFVSEYIASRTHDASQKSQVDATRLKVCSIMALQAFDKVAGSRPPLLQMQPRSRKSNTYTELHVAKGLILRIHRHGI